MVGRTRWWRRRTGATGAVGAPAGMRGAVRVVVHPAVRRGFGDQLALHVGRALTRRALRPVLTDTPSPAPEADVVAHVVLVPQQAGARWRLALDAPEVRSEQARGVPVALVGYGAPASTRAALDRVGALLDVRGAVVVPLRLAVDTRTLVGTGRLAVADTVAVEHVLDELVVRAVGAGPATPRPAEGGERSGRDGFTFGRFVRRSPFATRSSRVVDSVDDSTDHSPDPTPGSCP